MKCVNFIYETKQLMYSIKLQCKDLDNYTIDYFDFDKNSIGDFTDYLSFIDFSNYYFVYLNENNRTKKVSNYLNNNYEISTNVISYYDFIDSLDKSLQYLLKDEINKNEFLNNIRKKNIRKVLNNGYVSYITNMYPDYFRKGLIKHILLDNSSDVKYIDDTVIENMAINSELIFNNNDSFNIDDMPVIVNDKKNISKTVNAISINSVKLYQEIKSFITYSSINAKTPTIRDYGFITGLNKLNSITICNGEWFIDTQKTISIANGKIKYKELINDYFSSINKNAFGEINPLLISIFPLLININSVYGPDLKYITPFSKGVLDPVDRYFDGLSWIAFGNIQSNKYYAYNLLQGRLFEVDLHLFEVFEYVIKGKIESADNVDNAKKLEEILNDFE